MYMGGLISIIFTLFWWEGGLTVILLNIFRPKWEGDILMHLGKFKVCYFKVNCICCGLQIILFLVNIPT